MTQDARRKTQDAFTLIELLIVIAIISILVGITLPRFRGMQEEGNIAESKAELRTLQTAVESFYIHNNSTYPSALANLTSATPNIVNFIPLDPFAATNTSYSYVRGGTNNKFYVIFSVGTGEGGTATISNNTVSETNPTSCIYVSNAVQDTQP